ncbi:arpin [Denticeps clupeoides]|uniref:Arpin n=1 Tax=Denticeps clupeoides TaxID=299321 RepID=A0AAY4B2D0_9TELE|nr:arpin [Denticeps clupeoides]
MRNRDCGDSQQTGRDCAAQRRLDAPELACALPADAESRKWLGIKFELKISAMSRIYHNEKLQNKPVHNEKFPGVWDPSSFQSGPGVILEGKLIDISRHAITDVNDEKGRFGVLYVKPSRIHRRKFDTKGNEIEPNFSETKKVNTGYLMSSFKVEAKGETDRLSVDQLRGIVNKQELLGITEKHGPNQTFAFWLPEAEMERTELGIDQEIRLKTNGDGPFIFSFAKLDGGTVTKCNFAGDTNAGDSWTDKIMANKAEGGNAATSGGHGDGADDEEWDD